MLATEPSHAELLQLRHGRTDVLDVVAEHHLVEDLSTRHADERVIHGGRAVRLQWLDIVAVLAIEGRRRPCPRLRLCSCGGALRPLRIVLGAFCGGCLRGSAEGREGVSLCAGGKAACALESVDRSCA